MVMYSSSTVVSLVVEIYATDSAATEAFALKKTVKATPPTHRLEWALKSLLC